MALDSANQVLLNDILAVYTQAENEMLAKVAKNSESIYNNEKLGEVQSINNEINKVLTKAQGQAMDILAGNAKQEYDTAAGIEFDDGISDYVKDSVNVASQYMKQNFGTSVKKVTQSADDFKGKNSDAFMFVDPKDSSVIHVNPSKFKGKNKAQIDKMLSKSASEYHKNMDMGSLVVHEYGHVIASNKNLMPTMDKLIANFTKTGNIKDLAKDISNYAGTDKAELFAEALADHYKNGESSSKFSKELAKEVEVYTKKQANEDIKEKFNKKSFHQLMDDTNVPMNLRQLVMAANNVLTNAKFQVLRNVDDGFREIQANASTALLSGMDTTQGVTQRMLNEFAGKGLTTFVDKAGRNWDLASYAEMCARTVGARAALQGHMDRQEEVGEDLVKVSSIGTTCPICLPWQGVVLSISGQSTKYHSVDEAKAAGLFHPNCRHTLVMYIPELDDGTSHEGKVEPAKIEGNPKLEKIVSRNKIIEQQRANERKIRYWKKREAVAITPEAKAKAAQKKKYHQYSNALYCEKHNLRRQYAREGVRTGNASGKMGPFVGGSKAEFVNMYKDVIGTDPGMVFKAVDFSEKNYDKWLKSEIKSLNQLDIDKAQMKDASNKAVTPTSLYKKYISDTPTTDYATVSPYEKGSADYKKGYAKWLKEQIDEIGVSYKVKPEYKVVHEDIPAEDMKLSATEMYKKYNPGHTPTQDYKELGGEEGTGMKYAKWVESKKKDIITYGITKTVPFENNVVEKSSKVFSEATKTVEKAKKTIDDEYMSLNENAKVYNDAYTKEALNAELKTYESKAEHVKKGNPNSKLLKIYEQEMDDIKAALDYKAKKAAAEQSKHVAYGLSKVFESTYSEDELKALLKSYEEGYELAKKQNSTPGQLEVYENSIAGVKQALENKANNKPKIIHAWDPESPAMKDYKADLDKNITGAYSASQEVKKTYEALEQAKGGPKEPKLFAEQKYKIAKEKHLEMVEKKAKKQVGTDDFNEEVKILLNQIDKAKESGNKAAETHLNNQYKVYTKVEKEAKAEQKKAEKEKKQAEKLKKLQKAEVKKASKNSLGLLSDDAVISACEQMESSLSRGSKELQRHLEKEMDKALNQMGCEKPKKGVRGSCYFDIHDYYSKEAKKEAIDNMKPWQAIGDYTSGSRPHNFAYKENQTAKDYFLSARYTREQARQVVKKLDQAFEVPSATISEYITVRHGNTEDGVIGMLGDDLDFEDYSHENFIEKLKTLNKKAASDTVILNETGFLSTSPFSNGGFSGKPVEVRIVLPPGTKGLYVNEYSWYDNEKEILLKRNQKFKFVKAYSRDLDKDEFEKEKDNMYDLDYFAKTVIYLQALPE